MLKQLAPRLRPFLIFAIILISFSSYAVGYAQSDDTYTVVLEVDELRCVDEQEDRVTDVLGEEGDEVYILYSLFEAESIDDDEIDSVSNVALVSPLFEGLQGGDEVDGDDFDELEIEIHEGNYLIVAIEIMESEQELDAAQDTLTQGADLMSQYGLSNTRVPLELICGSVYCESFAPTLGEVYGWGSQLFNYIRNDDSFGNLVGWLSWDEIEDYEGEDLENVWVWETGVVSTIIYEMDFTVTIED